MIDEAQLREDMVRLSRSLFERGFSVGSAGNISARVDDGLLVTPTNSCLGWLEAGRIAKLDLAGKHVSGDKPSKEVPLHQAFYETRPGVGAVVHLHSTYATAISCLPDVDPEDCIAPLTPYVVMRVGKVALLPYTHPGDAATGELIRGLEGKYAAVLLGNHGPVVTAKDLTSAVYAAEEMEETARLLMMMRGEKPRFLTEQQVAELNERFPK